MSDTLEQPLEEADDLGEVRKTAKQFATAQVQALRRHGFTVEVWLGAQRWADFMRSNVVKRPDSDKTTVNPEFDPAVNPSLHQGEQLTLACCWQGPGGGGAGGIPVATVVSRLYRFDGGTAFLEAARNYRLWYDDGLAALPARHRRPLHVILDPDAAPSGWCALTGGGWTHPRFQGIGLSAALVRLAHAMGVDWWGIDHGFCLLQRQMWDRGLPFFGWWYERKLDLAVGFFNRDEEGERAKPLQLGLSPRQFLVESMAAETARLGGALGGGEGVQADGGKVVPIRQGDD